jgi:hypothetical protein
MHEQAITQYGAKEKIETIRMLWFRHARNKESESVSTVL